MVKRDKIFVYSLDVFYMIKDKIGYICINCFVVIIYEEFKKVLIGLQKKGMKDLIFDLQGNGGGYLNVVIDIVNEFLGKKELIVYMEGCCNFCSEFFVKGMGEFQNGCLMVLVDEFLVFVSEIVIGVVQDWDRGVVVGCCSFGKGLVQCFIDLLDGLMICLMVVCYYMFVGCCIQKFYESIEKYNEDLIDCYNKGEMMSEDSIYFLDLLKFKIYRLVCMVYGGGGIMFDYFVLIDMIFYIKYYCQLCDKGVLMKVYFYFIDVYCKEWLGKYKIFNEFYKCFEVILDMLI